jgi:hypothetical protein
MQWEDGSVYYGEFVDGVEHGEGKKVESNGNLYLGKFINSMRHGVGIYVDVTASTKRHGEWKDDKRMSWLSGPMEINLSTSSIKKLDHLSQLHIAM